jgi:PAS domain S-box-containing protein
VINYANQMWYEITGYPAATPITNWGDYIADEHREHIGKLWGKYVADVQQETVQGEFQWKTGRWVSCLCMRLKPISGVRPGIIGCIMDITDRKLSEELQQQRVVEAETRRAEAEEAKRLQEELIDITSHEIRNPISSIMGLAAILRENLCRFRRTVQVALDAGTTVVPTAEMLATMDEDMEALDNIHACGLTQERISNDVLSLGKLSLDKLAMFDVATDVRAEVSKLVSVFHNEAAMARVELNLGCSPNLSAAGGRLLLDPVRFGQVVTNLLSNAIRFTSTSREYWRAGGSNKLTDSRGAARQRLLRRRLEPSRGWVLRESLHEADHLSLAGGHDGVSLRQRGRHGARNDSGREGEPVPALQPSEREDAHCLRR